MIYKNYLKKIIKKYNLNFRYKNHSKLWIVQMFKNHNKYRYLQNKIKLFLFNQKLFQKNNKKNKIFKMQLFNNKRYIKFKI